MPETPIDVIINGLKSQISELKDIISGLNNDQNTSNATSATSTQIKSLENERDVLKIENIKYNYRITHLLRTLDKKDYEISLLKKDLSSNLK